MGTGKTAIVLHALHKINRPALVIAPLRAAYTTWPDEIAKWNLPLSYAIIHGKDKVKAINSKVDVYITNYESIPFIYNTMAALVKAKKKPPFDICVLDEGSMVKDPSTKRFKYLKALRVLFPTYRTILSGTPSPNSLLELWSQYTWLIDEPIFGSLTDYKSTYFYQDPFKAYTYKIKPEEEEEIYKKVAPHTFRLDERDSVDLPPIIYNTLKIALPDKYKELYNELREDLILTIGDIDHVAFNAASLSQKLRQFLQGFLYGINAEGEKATTELHTLKLDRLKEVVEETGQPILCAVQYKHDVVMIHKAFPDAPVIAGGTSATDATNYIRQWNRGEIPLLLCHPASMGHGVNLQSGGRCIVWYCLPWSLEQYLQFNKRIHRSGQVGTVVINHILIDKTIDNYVAQVLAAKQFSMQKLLDYLRRETNGNTYK